MTLYRFVACALILLATSAYAGNGEKKPVKDGQVKKVQKDAGQKKVDQKKVDAKTQKGDVKKVAADQQDKSRVKVKQAANRKVDKAQLVKKTTAVKGQAKQLAAKQAKKCDDKKPVKQVQKGGNPSAQVVAKKKVKQDAPQIKQAKAVKGDAPIKKVKQANDSAKKDGVKKDAGKKDPSKVEAKKQIEKKAKQEKAPAK